MAEEVLKATGTVGKQRGGSTLPLRKGSRRTALSPPVQVLSVLGATGLAYLAINLHWLELVTRNDVLGTYLAQPLLWGLVAVAVLLLSWKGARQLQFKAGLVPVAGLTGLFHVAALVLAGLFAGFGSSPYTHQFPAVLVNVAYFGSALVAVELARAYLLTAWRPRRLAPAILSVGGLFAFLTIPLSQITSLQTAEGTVQFVGLRALPSLGEHALTTYIALSGGPLAALAYRGTLQAFHWLSPALPNLPWALSGILALVVPYVGFLAFRTVAATVGYAANGRGAAGTRVGQAQAKGAQSPGWLVLAFISVGIIWFSLGLFPYRPFVVGGESMSPYVRRGDVAIVHPVNPPDIAVGDVVQYRVGDSSILHRVIGVQESNRARFFVTKGDANNTPDPSPVHPSQVVGKVALRIPKVGWMGIMARKALATIAGFL